MSQTLKPDRPIWPPIPETTVPPDTTPAEAEPTERDAASADRPAPESAAGKLSAFEGFGSFSG